MLVVLTILNLCFTFTGPLAVIAFAFIACKNWVEQGWELDDNPAATAFEIFWMFFEPMLFGITGAQVVVSTNIIFSTYICVCKCNKTATNRQVYTNNA